MALLTDSAPAPAHVQDADAFRLPEVVRYASDPEAIDAAVAQHFGSAQLVGFDIEWRPNFARGQDNATAVVQVATNSACLVAHVAHTKVLPPQHQTIAARPTAPVGVILSRSLSLSARDKLFATLFACTHPHPRPSIAFNNCIRHVHTP